MVKTLLTSLLAVISLAVSVQAAPVWDVPAKVRQGRAFLVHITDQKPFRGNVLWNGASYPAASSPKKKGHGSYVLLAMPIGTQKPLKVKADLSGGSLSASVVPLAVKWPRQVLTVAPKYVAPPPEVLDRIEKDRRVSRKALETVTEPRRWALPLHRPVPGAVSSVFGGRRVFNGQPRSPHLGTDLRGAAGTPVETVADGTVLAAADMYFSGNTVFIDHGRGVISMYCHLSAFSVKEGDTVKRGGIIGKVGATGRGTGPHLHCGLYIGKTPVDVMPLFDPALSHTDGPGKARPNRK